MFGFSFFWQKRRNQIKYIRCIAIFTGGDIIKIVNTSDVRCNKRKCGPAEREKTEEIGLAR